MLRTICSSDGEESCCNGSRGGKISYCDGQCCKERTTRCAVGIQVLCQLCQPRSWKCRKLPEIFRSPLFSTSPHSNFLNESWELFFLLTWTWLGGLRKMHIELEKSFGNRSR